MPSRAPPGRVTKLRGRARASAPAYRRRIAELEAMLGLVTQINAGRTLEEVLERVYRDFRVLIPYDRIGCALIDAGSGRVRSVWARSRAERIALPAGYAAPLAGSSLADVVATGRPRILNDLERYLRAHPASEATRLIVAEGIRSSLTCPLIADAKPIGFLFFSSTERGAYTAAHTAAYQEIAAIVSVILEKSRAFGDVLETKKRLATTNGALARAAYFDALTGVPGRRYFDRLLEREWNRARRQAEPLSVLVIDIDHFKLYNDTYGHPAGDRCLRRVAEALQDGARRGTDLVARIGGEEFAAVLSRTGVAEAQAFAERLRRSVEELKLVHERSPVAPHVTISLGVACSVPGREDEVSGLLRLADAGLYRAKDAGRNRVAVATPA